MTNLLLYFATSFIWGSTWLAIQYQIGIVTPAWSVTYRFGIAAICLFIYCLATRQDLKFNKKQHLWIALQGFLLFSANYILYYVASEYFISGILAVIFATISIMNIFNGKIFFKNSISFKVLIGAIIGLSGLTCIFWSQLGGVKVAGNHITEALIGLGIAVSATYCASLGNMVSSHNQRKKIPILQTNAIGMAYGALFALIIALINHEPPTFVWSFNYVASLLYLSIFGSILAFGCYLKLLGRIGADRAAYAFVFIPVIALGLSTLFENFHWGLPTLFGIMLVLFGNVLVLQKDR